MKLYIIIDETRFYHPHFLAKFLGNTPDTVAGAGLVTEIPPKNSIENYLKEHWYYLRLSEMLKLAYDKYSMAVKDVVCKKSKDKPFYSVRSVLKFFNIDFMEVKNNVNRKEYLDVIRSKQPDVIVSSNSMIFKDDILQIPKICCVNRHSALLPSYGGLWPVFQAYRNGEEYTGVTIHTMQKAIDKGIVLAQKRIRIKKSETIADLYEKCFDASADVLLEALGKIRNHDFTPYRQNNPPSYFSFPTKEHWDDFRKRGGRFI